MPVYVMAAVFNLTPTVGQCSSLSDKKGLQ